MDITGLHILTRGLSDWPGLAFGAIIVWKLIILVFGIFWIMMLVDCLKRKFSTDMDKIAWILVLIFVPGIGAFVYLFFRIFQFKKRK